MNKKIKTSTLQFFDTLPLELLSFIHSFLRKAPTFQVQEGIDGLDAVTEPSGRHVIRTV